MLMRYIEMSFYNLPDDVRGIIASIHIAIFRMRRAMRNFMLMSDYEKANRMIRFHEQAMRYKLFAGFLRLSSVERAIFVNKVQTINAAQCELKRRDLNQQFLDNILRSRQKIKEEVREWFLTKTSALRRVRRMNK